jgi:hypothetical protein
VDHHIHLGGFPTSTCLPTSIFHYPAAIHLIPLNRLALRSPDPSNELEKLRYISGKLAVFENKMEKLPFISQIRLISPFDLK